MAEVVVACSRLPVKLTDIGTNVTVLNRDDFDADQPTQLSDVLRNVAGVHIDEVGGRGGTGSLYLRGADPNYTLVLVNGVRVNDPTNARGGSFDFSMFDVDDIERIEVARGPYSSVFGGDALAGVINIVTRDGSGGDNDFNASADAMAGAYGTHELALRAGGSVDDGSWTLGVGDSKQGEVVRGNQFDAQRVSGSFTDTLGGTRVQLTARYADTARDTFPDDSGGYQFAAIRDTEHRQAHESVFGAGFTRDSGDSSLRLALGYFDRGEIIDSPGVAPGIRDPFGIPPSVVNAGMQRFTATFNGNFSVRPFLEVAYGAEYQHEQGTSDGQLDFGGGFVLPTSFELTRSSWAPFAEARVSTYNGFSAQAGVRVDKPDAYGSVTSPRLRVAYDFGTHGAFTVAGAWGKAFKLPSMYALGHPIVGNPDLVPERSESHELSVAQSLLNDTVNWSLTWFDGEFRNAIDFDPGPPPMLVNRDRVDTQGFELAGHVSTTEDLVFDASVTQARSRVASTGDELRNRPEWRAGAGVHWTPIEPLRLTGAVTYVGSSRDSSIATGDVTLPSYTLVDVSASWQVAKNFEAYAAIDNLTDQQYQQFVGFEVRGIMPRVGVKFSL
ncbi:MAG TPA: TonB-dependent receptor [Steroidobacteraceae bacterium]|nr:TonB-dependent receptor [Steroidobacteraceae bacterium]